jgi:hypothetical protein
MDDLGTLLLIALVLACPIAMIWMMRGRHRAHGHNRPGRSHSTTTEGDKAARPEVQQGRGGRDHG